MNLKLFSLLLLVLFYKITAAQDPVIFNGQPDLKSPLNIADQTLFYQDSSGDTLSFEQIKKQQFFKLSKPFWQVNIPEHPLIVNWLKFRIQNTSRSDTVNLVFMCNTHVFTRLYTDEHPNQQQFSFEQTTTDAKGMQLTVPPGKTNTYYVRVIEFVHYLLPLKAELHTPLTYLQNAQRNTSNVAYLLLVMCVALGCLLFMAIFAGYQFLLTRDLAIAYYTIYVCCAFYVWLVIIDQRFSLEIFNPLRWKFNIPVSSGVVFFYALFIARMLHISRDFSKKWRVLQFLLGLIIIETFLEILANHQGRFLFGSNTYYLYIQNIPNLLVNLYLIYLIIISKGTLKGYLLAGITSLFFMLIVVTNLSYYILFEVESDKFKMFVNFPPIFGMLGVVLESICFAFALVYRSKLVQMEKDLLQDNYAGQLEQELMLRTKEIKEQNSLLETQKMQQIETVFEKKLAETEMTALRAQMNPHFIFNCLNSIKLYTLENDSKAASAYLTTFSRLIRLVLENSRSEKVTLENELETLRLYIELEVMRFKEKVKFIIEVAEGIDISYIEVPPLLIQPYVENAIWHGLMHNEIGGTVLVKVSQPDDHLLHIEIIDDGVGRKQSALYKSKSTIKHKSFGQKMTAERIGIINQLYDSQTTIKIIDLNNADGKPCGTQVSIDIPI